MNELARVKRCLVWAAWTLLMSSGCGSSSGLNVDHGRVDAATDADAASPGESDASFDVMPGPQDASTDAEASVVPDAGDASDPVDLGRTDTGPANPGPADTGTSDPRFEVEMTFTTANIGRNYRTRSEMQAVINKLGDAIGAKSGPKYIGWQEIGEGDPCGGSCEIDAIRNRFKSQWGWSTRRPQGRRPDGRRERARVPVTSRGASANGSARAKFASPGWAGVSPTRFVTVVHYPNRNISLVNTHFIAGAWSCKSNLARRRDYWRRAWSVLKAEVAKEQNRGRNVIVTGDLNRPRGQNNCNPAWNPTSLHGRAKIIGGASIDYIFAVPSAGYKFAVARGANGTKKNGSIYLGIDGHKAHWVRGRFLPK